jgi:transcriptional regulator with XRE-family HTH domain
LARTLGTARQAALIELLVRSREAAGLTQSDLAARLGQYQSFVARLESGQRRIDVVEFIALADILGFDPAAAIEDLRRIAPAG